jgi:pyruvate/2-oxoglutarate dehydrogenase complex dihydrolipoamide acyltransferase (E2) component
MEDKPFRLEPIPRYRRFSIDAGRLGRGKHIIHGLIEVDITDARRIMRAYQAKTGERPSLTAFVICCLASAIESNDHLHAYMDWRRRLVIYDDVDVNVLLEGAVGGVTVPVPHILKAVNKKSYLDIHSEIRTAQANPRDTQEVGFMRWFLWLPWILRRPFYWLVLRMPQLFRGYSSPVLVTAVGMFGKGAGWGIPMANFTLTVTLGGALEKPAVVNGEIKPRELLDVTVSIDHDVVDGAPAARFVGRFRELVETSHGLDQLLSAGARETGNANGAS